MKSRSARTNKVDWSALSDDYQKLKPLADRFCIEITNQLSALVTSGNLSLGVPIEYRVKKWDSIKSKIERLSLCVKSIEDIQDLIGVRLIFLFRRDAEKACELLKTTFNVIRMENTEERLKADQFGYSSIHFIIKLPKEWLTLPTLSQLGELKAEIQVRSVAQHIWAATSHLLQYKQEKNVPVPVRRAIHRVSALLETVDLEFERLLEQREAYRDGVASIPLDEELNVDLLEKILDELLPTKNKNIGEEDYSDLLRDLSHFKITKANDLRTIITKQKVNALKADKKLVDDFNPEEDHYDSNLERILKDRVYFSHTGLTRSAMEFEYGDKFTMYLCDKAPNYLNY